MGNTNKKIAKRKRGSVIVISQHRITYSNFERMIKSQTNNKLDLENILICSGVENWRRPVGLPLNFPLPISLCAFAQFRSCLLSEKRENGLNSSKSQVNIIGSFLESDSPPFFFDINPTRGIIVEKFGIRISILYYSTQFSPVSQKSAQTS